MPTQVQIDTMSNPIIIERAVYRDREYLNIRFYYRDNGTGELRPSAQGINIPVQFALAVHKGIGEVLESAIKSKPKKNHKK